MASQITARTRALVIINPNNPTGAVYSREILLGLLELARKHGLLVLTDEIYDQILYDGAVHYSAAVARARPAGTDARRTVQDLPAGWLPVRLARDLRSARACR